MKKSMENIFFILCQQINGIMKYVDGLSRQIEYF